MKKPDFSKPAMKQFMLLHAEKLILGLSVFLLALFFWMGFKVKPYSETTPTGMSELATEADQYMGSTIAWDTIKPFRKGTNNVATVVENEKEVDASLYEIEPVTGIAVAPLRSRKDPVILPVTELAVRQFRAPLLLAMKDDFTNAYVGLPVVEPKAEKKPGLNSGGSGGDSDAGDAGGSSLGGEDRDEPKSDIPEIDGGTQLYVVNEHTMGGMRPVSMKISGKTTKPIMYNIVVVTGLVDFQQQWRSFADSFEGGIGYYPDRDKPIYQYLQVERTKVAAGEEDKWEDISEQVSYRVPSFFPEMHKMPQALYPSAPEIVAPENYDPLITGPIPPIAMVNYRPYVNHPTLAENMRTFPPLKEEKDDSFDPNNIFNPTNPKAGATPGGAGPGGGPGGPSAPGVSGAGNLGGPGSGEGKGVEAKQTRKGSDFTDYWKALTNKNPKSQRLVRFFDISGKQGETYKYRCRVWLGDPNNEDTAKTFANMQGPLPMGFGGGGAGKGGRPGLGSGGAGGGGTAAPGDVGGTNNPGDAGGADKPGEGTADDGKEERVYEYVAINSKMQDQAVRERLHRAKEVEDPKTKKKTYFVAELRTSKTDAADADKETKEFVEIPVPTEREYLKYARPSEWSPTVEVTVNTSDSQVVAGLVDPPKTTKFTVNNVDKEFPVSEPEANVVASVFSETLATEVPSKRRVYRGDALDFNAAARVLNPVNWRVYVTLNDLSQRLTSPEKYMVPIETKRVVVDAMGGNELELDRSSKMQVHLPSEVLVMDSNGQFTVQNDLEDRTAYQNLLLLPDERQSVGVARAPKEPKDPNTGRGPGGSGTGPRF